MDSALQVIDALARALPDSMALDVDPMPGILYDIKVAMITVSIDRSEDTRLNAGRIAASTMLSLVDVLGNAHISDLQMTLASDNLIRKDRLAMLADVCNYIKERCADGNDVNGD